MHGMRGTGHAIEWAWADDEHQTRSRNENDDGKMLSGRIPEVGFLVGVKCLLFWSQPGFAPRSVLERVNAC